MESIRDLHLALRWGVLAWALVGLGWTLVARFRNRSLGRGGAVSASLFVGLLDLELLLGVVLLVGLDSRPWVHAGVMTVAVAAAHAVRVLGKRRPSPASERLAPWVYAAPLILIVVGLRLAG